MFGIAESRCFLAPLAFVASIDGEGANEFVASFFLVVVLVARGFLFFTIFPAGLATAAGRRCPSLKRSIQIGRARVQLKSKAPARYSIKAKLHDAPPREYETGREAQTVEAVRTAFAGACLSHQTPCMTILAAS